MALTVAKAQRLRATHTFDYAGESVTVEYFPARALAITQESLEAWARETAAAAEAEAEEAGGDTHAMGARAAALWNDVIAGWDVLMEEEGPPVALDDWDALFALGPHFLCVVLTECVRAAWDAKPSGTATSSGSAATSAPADGSTSLTVPPSQSSTKPRSSRSKRASRHGS